MNLLAVMMLALMSVAYVSCSSDDNDDPIGDGADSRIVGTWYDVNYNYTRAWRFEKNGKCQYTEWGKKGSEEWSTDSEDIGKWKVSGDKLNAHWTYSDGDYDDYTFVYSISEDGKTLTLSGGNYGKAGTYIKKN